MVFKLSLSDKTAIIEIFEEPLKNSENNKAYIFMEILKSGSKWLSFKVTREVNLIDLPKVGGSFGQNVYNLTRENGRCYCFCRIV